MASTLRRSAATSALAATAALSLTRLATPAEAGPAPGTAPHNARATATQIEHVVVLFGENISYDHYFGTYPRATNQDGVPFHAAKGTPSNHNVVTDHLLHGNPNSRDPFRIAPRHALTCDQSHAYGDEQKAYNNGHMNRFVQTTSKGPCGNGLYGVAGMTMGYFDGNTVTALWNYAQHYAMSDNNFGATFGPSTPGALNLVSGQTHGVVSVDPQTGLQTAVPDPSVVTSPDGSGVGTVIKDPEPFYDDCSNNNGKAHSNLAVMTGPNIGDRLSAQGVTWGWFQGGFTADAPYDGTSPVTCTAGHKNIGGHRSGDYSPHHEGFQYYASTANPHHLEPADVNEVGHDGPANHSYDLSWFTKALNAGNLPAVSYLKAPAYQDGHAGYSDPIDEQHFYVKYVNAIMKSQYWENTAVFITYDDSDGWYDHVAAPVSNGSNDPAQDQPWCSSGPAPANGYLDRCGPGPRLPLLAISPYARKNFVSHDLSTQASLIKFIQYNWGLAPIGDGSFADGAPNLTSLFDFNRTRVLEPLILRPNGSVK
ncbi:alkaline phosphatase family protein [Nocardioides panacisoli]|uniref:Alkaline phosphatase family protein n=1 Tax=Nocardioides panacisoli TaxID=627624 RepID=A0ABP7IXK4_9ACTN